MVEAGTAELDDRPREAGFARKLARSLFAFLAAAAPWGAIEFAMAPTHPLAGCIIGCWVGFTCFYFAARSWEPNLRLWAILLCAALLSIVNAVLMHFYHWHI